MEVTQLDIIQRVDLCNCWIEARISKDGIVTFNHCGDEGMKELVTSSPHARGFTEALRGG